EGVAVRGAGVVRTVPALANLGLRCAGTVSARAKICDPVYCALQYLFYSGDDGRLLPDLSAGGEIPARAGSGFPSAAEGRRLFRFHHSVDARHGHRLSDAGGDLHSGADWTDHRGLDVACLAHCGNRHFDCGRSFVAHERCAEHVAVRRADVCALCDFNSGRLDLWPRAPPELKLITTKTQSHEEGNGKELLGKVAKNR